jgi:hypothetical protein
MREEDDQTRGESAPYGSSPLRSAPLDTAAEETAPFKAVENGLVQSQNLATEICFPTESSEEPLRSSFESARDKIDLEFLDLIVQRRSLVIREALDRAACGADISPSLKPAETTLHEIVEAGRARGLDPRMVEHIFYEIVADSERAFQDAATAAVAEPRITQTVIRIARHREVPESLTSELLPLVSGIPGALGDERQTPDFLSTFELISSGAASIGFLRCDLALFEELARIVELLEMTQLKIIHCAPLDEPAKTLPEEERERVGSASILTIAKDILVRPADATWASWLFLRVPETRSVQSTDLLIRSLLAARQFRLDTSHLHSFPGMSYEGFSYARDAEGLETRPHYSQRGSRAFLIDARRSPGPEQLDQLVSALLEIGCAAQVLGCMPRSVESSSKALRDNPIQRSTAVLRYY